jgi:hypothetical protein
MHYEDVAYFGPEPELQPETQHPEPPKDETNIAGMGRVDTFPHIPEEVMNRLRARRSWDRQRRRRKKAASASASAFAFASVARADANVNTNEDAVFARAAGGGNNRPLPPLPRARAPPRNTKTSKHFEFDWLPEALWCLLSVLCLAAIAAVLKIYDGRSLDDCWPLAAISLNTLVAFLAAVC